ncbi:allantoicase [Mycobacterium stomatepiae]|uniref:Probable allantoicase n=1 Tax=Mycobacterium stomatepiae TaxID=470076 RepID=A0A7I7Q1A6_9MYCO|nr:allantoicase [Mycobacterium stomatepiae]MCV7166739.1 allantoicase [Mycobacterium stomatepiae]BBY20190.1 putative allantoicase [Mycobacterium stomatepiae]
MIAQFDPESLPGFTALPDLALRSLGGAVIWASDEFFAEKEKLIVAEPAVYRTATFGHKGQIYDGWETRRRRDHGYDQAIVRLGVPGVVRGVVVDTAWFKGNYPPEVSVEATVVDGYPPAAVIAAHSKWEYLLPRVKVSGDTQNFFEVSSDKRWTHVRLNIYPDGGVARFRVHGEGRPDRRLLGLGAFDLAALENGGLITGCSNRFYSAPQNLLFPGSARVMGEGWETARRRDGGNDWVQVRLAGEGVVRVAEIDTSHFLGNSPAQAALTGRGPSRTWVPLLARTDLLPDTRHRFEVTGSYPVTEVRLDIYPDGGLARLRLFGELTAAGRSNVERYWG